MTVFETAQPLIAYRVVVAVLTGILTVAATNVGIYLFSGETIPITRQTPAVLFLLVPTVMAVFVSQQLVNWYVKAVTPQPAVSSS